ncbi:tRNA uridine-5-carboxymethylaminomethyl(34) synthesis GTPase MnmE [Mangrovibrevibacter kandeliae]|uniref:tRNA uridine-5-carboxymethylaminomethyl(34) synthesis GTPase MnmE n=1 Tax=Mangrovibrevibacter kandeliae TaxID=2968473 RepID=UPI0021186E05|nr:tRNA uridine-5-carboxymethylaminomethyl(34) synthesis GTPase MnmE [Aurantimonas sp. CSK15Z-1]MCQ8782306.1 tRNA uridine-5-carboxymethylaminomethyl(34) synthesis GTPase MnmE [Aurantimonas sp. CSK15Z-1]
MSDTIVALSSGSLPSGIAVIRISGPASHAVLEAVAGGVPAPRRASLRTIRDAAGLPIDRGLVLFFDAPGTATGEDLAELHLHGGRAVVAAALAAACAVPGVRLAVAGEFTRRAFEHGRIDLTEAEGLADLLAAETELQRRAAHAQAEGGLRTIYQDWMSRLTRMRALLEASFDFADEGDVGEEVGRDVLALAERLAVDMDVHLARAIRGELLREGFRVAIVGAPNAGKSSLLNALAEREVAIVTDVPGTTRDVLEVTLDLGGVPVRLSDTAGLRDAEDAVERIGIERARRAAAEADLVLMLSDGTRRLPELVAPARPTHGESGGAPGFWMQHIEGRKDSIRLSVRSKIDVAAAAGVAEADYDHAVSTVTGEGLADLLEHLGRIAAEAAGGPDALPLRARQRELVTEARALLQEIDASEPPEVVAEVLRRTSDRLGALTGVVSVEDLLGVIFSEFCIGK